MGNVVVASRYVLLEIRKQVFDMNKINYIASLLLCCLLTLSFSFAPSLLFADTKNIRELKKLLELGKRYCEISRFDKAIAKYQEAFEKFNSPDAVYNLGITYEIDLGDKEKALYYYSRFLEMEARGVYSDNVRRWVNEIKAELKKNKTSVGFAKNRSPLKKRVTLEGHKEELHRKTSKKTAKDTVLKDVRMYKRLAFKEVRKKNYEKGVELYLKILELTPDSDAAYNLGLLYDHYIHNYEEAAYYYRKFLQLEPFSSDAGRVKEWLDRIEMELSDGP